MGQIEFEGMQPPSAKLTDEDWDSKWYELSELFSPAAPVQESDLFAGRVDQLARLVEAVFQRGQSAVVYGHRGVGKTSLVNTFQKKVFPTSSSVLFFSARCFKEDDFYDIWLRVVGHYKFEDGEELADEIDDALSPATILEICQRFKASKRPVFIFDEFDRIEDNSTKLKMAESIKLISDDAPNATIVLVGIGRTIRDLLAEHESVKRAARQIEMPRMSKPEIYELVTVRLGRVGMSVDQDTLAQIATLSRGMPGYAHLLGMYSAKQAIERKSLNVEISDVLFSLDRVLQEAGESTRQDYSKAVHSAKPNNQFREALLACALAKQNDIGAFTAASVRDPLSRIMKSARDIPAFARHLNAFCSPSRGPILEQFGKPKSYNYRFIEPHMQTYVIIKGVREQLIPPEDEAVVANLS